MSALRIQQTAPESIYSLLRNPPLCIEKEGKGSPGNVLEGAAGQMWWLALDGVPKIHQDDPRQNLTTQIAETAKGNSYITS